MRTTLSARKKQNAPNSIAGTPVTKYVIGENRMISPTLGCCGRSLSKMLSAPSNMFQRPHTMPRKPTTRTTIPNISDGFIFQNPQCALNAELKFDDLKSQNKATDSRLFRLANGRRVWYPPASWTGRYRRPHRRASPNCSTKFVTFAGSNITASAPSRRMLTGSSATSFSTASDIRKI
jgi:hypothetical protein